MVSKELKIFQDFGVLEKEKPNIFNILISREQFRKITLNRFDDTNLG